MQRIRDLPAGEQVDGDVELVLGGHVGRIAVPLEDAAVDPVDVLNEGQLQFQTGRRDRFSHIRDEDTPSLIRMRATANAQSWLGCWL